MSATPHSITEPLNLRGYLRTAPRGGWDFIAVLDVLLILGILFLYHSRFVYGSGVEIELARGEPGRLVIEDETAVLTVRAHEMMFFDGKKISPALLPEALDQFIADHPGTNALLLKVDRGISLQDLFGLFGAAREAGFVRVQIASEPPVEGAPGWSTR